MEVKSVGTFPVILLKLATPPLPPQTKLDLEQNGWKWVLFWATTLLGEVGGRRDEPKAEQKIVLGSRVLRNYCLEGLFHTVPSSFVLHCSTEDWNSTLPCPLKLSKKFKFYHWYYLRFYFLFLLLPIISTWQCPTRRLLLLWTLYTNELNVF